MCKMLSCFHIFHSECVVDWLVNRGNCPLCNKTFNKMKDAVILWREEEITSIEVDNDPFYSEHIINNHRKD